MALSLYRKYRPQSFNDVSGQKTAIDVLTNSIASNRIGHAYLFSGSRGCGKTSIARIYAKAINCLSPEGYEPCGKCRNCQDITAGESLDVIEIDGASNNGVENIRGLKENVTLAPFNSRYKVYIIDEVHMLSQGAFNALLKTLEEPPEYVVFILATTEPHKVPVTIRSRCQHIPFHQISPEDIYSRLVYVCAQENITAESEALQEIARQADGALRDALSLLEQVIASGDVTLTNVEAVFGAGSRPAFERWLQTFRTDRAKAYIALKSMFDAGASPSRIFTELFSLVRNLWLASKWPNILQSLGISSSEQKFIASEVSYWKPNQLHKFLGIIMKMLTHTKGAARNDILLGLFMMYIEPAPATTTQVISSGNIAQPAPAPAPVPAPARDLKAEMLERVHSRNFLMYCALQDVNPREYEGILILRVNHAYCYDYLKRNDAVLSAVYSEYERGILLEYGREQHIISPKPTKPEPTREQALTTQVKPVLLPPLPAPPTAPKTPDLKPEPVPEARPEPKTLKTREQTPYQSLMNELRRLGAKPEVLYEKEESDRDND